MYDIKQLEAGSVVNITYDTPIKMPEQRVVVLGTCGYEMAKSFEDVNATQKNIYSSLVAQPEDNTAKYLYLMFKGANGKIRVAADAWIRDVSVIKNLTVRFTVTVDNRDEIDEITKALAIRGLNDVKYEIVDNTAG
ncbi:hypothetical protein pEaSNUABM9_00057 [Erwinia phage pEa_SNUABM_9]|nr:hypothetical protein pEaSNUABM9_00057 [Erwinia phage pEa_SNUABM_9]